MKILRLEAENVKRLRVVEITPRADVLEITGGNGAGKSSVLDSIWYVLAGLRNIPAKPVREGEDAMTITAELGDKTVELIVTRTQAADGENARLTVQTAAGADLDSPQAVLNGLIGSLSFDPSAFQDAKPKEQLEMLRKLVPIEIDLDALDADNQRDFDERTGVSREVKALKARIDAYLIGPEWPTEKADIGALLTEAQRISDHNLAISQDGIERQRQYREGERLMRESAAKMEEARELRDRIARIIGEAERLQRSSDEILNGLKNQQQIAAPRDPHLIQEKIKSAEQTNEKVRLRGECIALETQLLNKQEEEDALTNRIERRRDMRRQAIATAPMPLVGLSFGEGEVLFNGLPLNQASDAEQLRISIGIAMAGNPKLRVIRLKHGSLLDDKSMAVLREMAAERDYQVWCERVDTTGRVGIYLEEGAVVFADEKMASALL